MNFMFIAFFIFVFIFICLFFCWIILMSFRVDTLEFIWFVFFCLPQARHEEIWKTKTEMQLIQNFLVLELTMGIWRRHELFNELLRFMNFMICACSCPFINMNIKKGHLLILLYTQCAEARCYPKKKVPKKTLQIQKI